MKKDKYLILADGKSSHTLKWIKELVKFYDLYLISLNGYDSALESYIVSEHIYSLNENVNAAGGNFRLLLKYFAIKKIVDKIKPHYVNAHYISSYGLLAALVKRATPSLKLIQSAWGTDILVTPFENKIKFYVAKFALSQANLITSDSFFMSDKIEEIYKKVPIETFAFGLEKRDEDADIAKNENLIFSNRALSENYNIEKIIKWFAQLRNDKMRLIIANDGDMRQDLEALAVRLNISKQVEFVGFLSASQQKDIYKKANYYISIPSSDSTSVSLLEAMQYGCYPILSNLPANREWVIDGCNGSFFRDDLDLIANEFAIQKINKAIIAKKAIFSKSIEKYIKKLKEI